MVLCREKRHFCEERWWKRLACGEIFPLFRVLDNLKTRIFVAGRVEIGQLCVWDSWDLSTGLCSNWGHSQDFHSYQGWNVLALCEIESVYWSAFETVQKWNFLKLPCPDYLKYYHNKISTSIFLLFSLHASSCMINRRQKKTRIKVSKRNIIKMRKLNKIILKLFTGFDFIKRNKEMNEIEITGVIKF